MLVSVIQTLILKSPEWQAKDFLAEEGWGTMKVWSIYLPPLKILL